MFKVTIVCRPTCVCVYCPSFFGVGVRGGGEVMDGGDGPRLSDQEVSEDGDIGDGGIDEIVDGGVNSLVPSMIRIIAACRF